MIFPLLNNIIINKTILKTSTIVGLFSGISLSTLTEIVPDNFLGIILLLWVLYGLTIILDWATGISAAKALAKKEGKEFKFDKTKSTISFYKNALFIIIMSTLYHLQKEAVNKDYNEFIINGITTIQLIFFCYNMLLEWLSIENNKYKITGEKSRLYVLLNNILNTIDKITIKHLTKFLNVK